MKQNILDIKGILVGQAEDEKGKTRVMDGARENRQEQKKKANRKEYVATQEAESVLSEILFVVYDLEQIQYEGFSQEEIKLYEKLDEVRKNNISKALRT